MQFIHRWEDNLKRADNHASVVEIPGAHHYLFLNEQGIVLGHIQSFLETLPK
jgi:pimeloyl-ACP methyl ester carboxylesterase